MQVMKMANFHRFLVFLKDVQVNVGIKKCKNTCSGLVLCKKLIG